MVFSYGFQPLSTKEDSAGRLVFTDSEDDDDDDDREENVLLDRNANGDESYKMSEFKFCLEVFPF